MTARSVVAAIFDDPEVAFEWILKVEADDATFDGIRATARKFKKLDFAFGGAISAIATGDLGRELTLKTEELARAGKLISGRQLLWLVYKYFLDKDQCASLNDYEDLLTVVLKHESNLRPFKRNWGNILMGCSVHPEEQFLETSLSDR